MLTLVLAVLAAMTVIMIAGWVYQRAVNNGGWSDVFWTFGTGATCSAAALAPIGDAAAPTWRQALVAGLMAVWAIRLGSYVMMRVARSPEDARYVEFRRAWRASFQPRMLGLLLTQAPATALLSVSVLLAARNPSPGVRPADLIGAAILAIAIVGETVADSQMRRFKAAATHDRSSVCDTGLWAWSRHPNYLFEWLAWTAYPIIAIRLADPWSFASLLAPLVMYAVLRVGTGIPPLEAAMLRSKGDAYRRYQARVSTFLPRPPRDPRP